MNTFHPLKPLLKRKASGRRDDDAMMTTGRSRAALALLVAGAALLGGAAAQPEPTIMDYLRVTPEFVSRALTRSRPPPRPGASSLNHSLCAPSGSRLSRAAVGCPLHGRA